MISNVLSLAFCIAAGAGLWWLWRLVGRRDPVVAAMVGLGFAVRAIGGTALFFVSYFSLPIAGALQSGGGFWFFAPDARQYYAYAVEAALGGPGDILALGPELPSVFYIQALATVMLLAGTVPSVGVLLNVAAYLATCALLVAWERHAQLGVVPLRFGIAAVSFFPSWILWSFQPLKDSLFLMLMVAFAFVAARWTDADPSRRFLRTTALALGAIGALLYAIAAVRWYVAVLLACATAIAWLVELLQSPVHRLARLASVVVFLLMVPIVIPLAAGPYLPEFGQAMFRPRSASDVVSAPLRAAKYVEEKRLDSVATIAETMILLPARSRRSLPGGHSAALKENASDLTMFERLFPRAVAMFLPRVVGASLGWVEIRGGRGLWPMAELDTLFFDATLISVGWLLWRSRSSGYHVRPVFVQVAVTTFVLTGIICYQTANFGTQFRLRSMVAVGFVLLVFGLARRPRSDAAGERSSAAQGTTARPDSPPAHAGQSGSGSDQAAQRVGLKATVFLTSSAPEIAPLTEQLPPQPTPRHCQGPWPPIELRQRSTARSPAVAGCNSISTWQEQRQGH